MADDQNATPDRDNPDLLPEFTNKELRDYAESLGIEVDSRATKADLIGAITGKPTIKVASAVPTQSTRREYTEADVRRDRDRMTFLWQAEPKIGLMIPIDPLNPASLVVPVNINGVVYRHTEGARSWPGVPRGKTVFVPESVAEVLVNSGYVSDQMTIKPGVRDVDTGRVVG